MKAWEPAGQADSPEPIYLSFYAHHIVGFAANFTAQYLGGIADIAARSTELLSMTELVARSEGNDVDERDAAADALTGAAAAILRAPGASGVSVTVRDAASCVLANSIYAFHIRMTPPEEAKRLRAAFWEAGDRWLVARGDHDHDEEDEEERQEDQQHDDDEERNSDKSD